MPELLIKELWVEKDYDIISENIARSIDYSLDTDYRRIKLVSTFHTRNIDKNKIYI